MSVFVFALIFFLDTGRSRSLHTSVDPISDCLDREAAKVTSTSRVHNLLISVRASRNNNKFVII